MTINYKRTFAIAMYGINETLGMDNVELLPNEGIIDAWDRCRELAERCFYENYPELKPSPAKSVAPLAEIQQQKVNGKRPTDQVQGIIYDINSCTDPIVLESYHMIAKTKPELQEAYNTQLQKLSK